MTEENVEMKDGLKIRKLTELKTSTEEELEEAMLKRVEYFKEQDAKKSQFNSTLQNTFFQVLGSLLDVKVQIDKAIGEENLEKLHKTIDNILLFGL
jgi:transcription termination factor NusB